MYIIPPIIFVIYPVLFLFLKNFKTVSPVELYVPLATSSVSALLLILIFQIFLKDLKRAAILVSMFMILFFSFGHISYFVNKLSLSLFSIFSGFILIILFSLIFFLFKKSKGKDKIILTLITFLLLYSYGIDLLAKFIGIESIEISRDDILLWTYLIVTVAFYVLVKNIKKILFITSIFTTVSIALLAVLFISYSPVLYSVVFDRKDVDEISIAGGEISEKPDIYYIILDAYGRSDILKEIYNYDNSSLIEFLKNSGFFVAKDAISNYDQTELSLASSLNMDYLQTLVEDFDKDSDDRGVLFDLIQKNRVISILKNRGYKFISISSGDSNTEFYDADMYMYDRNSPLTEFRNSLISMTPIPRLPIRFIKNLQYEIHRNRIKYAFSTVGELKKDNRPIFVFAHIMSPHAPFVFRQDFSEINPEVPYSLADASHFLKTSPKSDYISGYKEQVEFVSKKTEKMVSNIIKNSGKSTIVIIQGDHGPGSGFDFESIQNSNLKERMSILNAIRAPNLNEEEGNQLTSPINTFRVIFNSYFKTDFEILPNKSYFSPYTKPYDLSDITYQLTGN